MKILSLDPGGTTGYVVARVGEELEILASGVIPWEDRHGQLAYILEDDYDAVVVESFQLFPHKAMSQIGNAFPSSQVIGIIEHLLWRKDALDKLVYQNPSVMARVNVPKDFSKNPHLQSAFKHLRYYAVVHEGMRV